jgi:hypothetical protein
VVVGAESDSAVISVLPVIGIAAGVAMAYWAPLGRKASTTTPAGGEVAPPD